jgi:predicted oxidoreductase
MPDKVRKSCESKTVKLEASKWFGIFYAANGFG